MHISQIAANEDNQENRMAIIEALKRGSIVQWTHFNFYGEYDFSDKNLRDSIGFNLPQIMKLKVA
jgi:hypothetical protein